MANKNVLQMQHNYVIPTFYLNKTRNFIRWLLLQRTMFWFTVLLGVRSKLV